jgi:hypothetical protein
MADIYGAPQPLTGGEMVNIVQVQNGLPVICTITLSQIISLLAIGLPTTIPDTHGVLWNDNGVVSIS